MTHDQELQLYNRIVHQLGQIEGIMLQMNAVADRKGNQILHQGTALVLQYMEELKTNFNKYSELQ